MYFNYSFTGIFHALLRILAVSVFMLVVYIFKGVMAGDVKLLGMIAGFLESADVIKFIILIF